MYPVYLYNTPYFDFYQYGYINNGLYNLQTLNTSEPIHNQHVPINSNNEPKQLSKNKGKNNRKYSQKTDTMKTSTDKPIAAPVKYDVLKRNEKNTNNAIKSSHSQPKIDIDRDFPPITNIKMSKNNELPVQNLDFKLALQKPKEITPKETEATKPENDGNNDTVKTKKKRKRKRKNKIQTDYAEPFSYVDEEFPDLKEIAPAPIAGKKEAEKRIVTSDNSKTDRKLKRRQLLLFLPGDLENQVKIVPVPTPNKNKVKGQRKTGINNRALKTMGHLNPLDLHAPSLKRGKERLKPKVKKPSKLKKTILLYRKQRKEQRENQTATEDTTENAEKTEEVILPEAVQKKPDNRFGSKIHSRHFREYCDHMVSGNINSIISDLLKMLIGFQDKLYHRDPVKAKQKRRLCFGLREVSKYARMRKLRLIVIAPDLEKVDFDGGLDDMVAAIREYARQFGIPCVFGMTRSSLAYLCFKKYRVAAVGVFNYDGAEVLVRQLMSAVEEAREQYSQITQLMKTIDEEVTVTANKEDDCEITPTNLGTTVGHSRNPSNALSEPISDIGDMNHRLLLFDSVEEDSKQVTASSINVDELRSSLQGESKDVEEKLDELEEEHKEDREKEDELVDELISNILDKVSKIRL